MKPARSDNEARKIFALKIDRVNYHGKGTNNSSDRACVCEGVKICQNTTEEKDLGLGMFPSAALPSEVPPLTPKSSFNRGKVIKSHSPSSITLKNTLEITVPSGS
jgi:hypothetical protein